MSDSDGTSRWTSEAGHRLVTAKPELEKRLNRKARELKKLNPETDADRVRLLTIEITSLLFKVFEVRGKDVTGGIDDTFLDLSREAINSYTPTAETPFTHYFRYLYGRRRYNQATRSEQLNASAFSLDEHIESSGDTFADPSSADQWEDGHLFSSDIGHLSNAEIIAQENETVDAGFVRFLTLVIGFFDHATDKRDYTDEKKLYIRLFFTEAVTRLVKVQSSAEECEPFERHEHEVFSSLELAFQDAYTVDVCRAIREIWSTDLKPDHKPVKPGDYAWKLSNGFIRWYLTEAYGKTVTDPAITQQRNNYKKLVARCGLANDSD